jgi:ketosteroid isomerase-like protein
MDAHQPGAGRLFYERQVAYRKANDVDGLVAAHYHADAVLVTFATTVRGHEALKAYFRGYLQQLGYLDVLATDKFVESGDTIFLEATVRTALGTARVYDAFVLRAGKISHHFAGVIGTG